MVATGALFDPAVFLGAWDVDARVDARAETDRLLQLNSCRRRGPTRGRYCNVTGEHCMIVVHLEKRAWVRGHRRNINERVDDGLFRE